MNGVAFLFNQLGAAEASVFWAPRNREGRKDAMFIEVKEEGFEGYYKAIDGLGGCDWFGGPVENLVEETDVSMESKINIKICA